LAHRILLSALGVPYAFSLRTGLASVSAGVQSQLARMGVARQAEDGTRTSEPLAAALSLFKAKECLDPLDEMCSLHTLQPEGREEVEDSR